MPAAASPCVLVVSAGRQQFFRLRAVTAGAVGPGSFVNQGQFQVQVAGLPGYNYRVQASTDLVSWLSLQTNPAPFVFVDTSSTNYPCRFYRTVFVP